MKYQKWLMTLIMLGALALLLMAGSVFSHTVPTGTAIVTYTAVTQRTDNTTITGAVTYTISVGSCPSLATVAYTQTISGLTHTFNLPAGTYCFNVVAREAGGNPSGPSNTPTKTIVIAPPKPPVVTISSNGYVWKQWADGRKVFSLVASGSVPVGVACDLLPVVPAAGVTTVYGMAAGKVAECGPG